jgi:argininosuccinate lyase
MLVQKGMSFRDAYRSVGNDIEAGNFHFDAAKGLQHSHEGSIGNLCTGEIRQAMQRVLEKIPIF